MHQDRDTNTLINIWVDNWKTPLTENITVPRFSFSAEISDDSPLEVVSLFSRDFDDVVYDGHPEVKFSKANFIVSQEDKNTVDIKPDSVSLTADQINVVANDAISWTRADFKRLSMDGGGISTSAVRANIGENVVDQGPQTLHLGQSAVEEEDVNVSKIAAKYTTNADTSISRVAPEYTFGDKKLFVDSDEAQLRFGDTSQLKINAGGTEMEHGTQGKLCTIVREADNPYTFNLTYVEEHSVGIRLIQDNSANDKFSFSNFFSASDPNAELLFKFTSEYGFTIPIVYTKQDYDDGENYPNSDTVGRLFHQPPIDSDVTATHVPKGEVTLESSLNINASGSAVYSAQSMHLKTYATKACFTVGNNEAIRAIGRKVFIDTTSSVFDASTVTVQCPTTDEQNRVDEKLEVGANGTTITSNYLTNDANNAFLTVGNSISLTTSNGLQIAHECNSMHSTVTSSMHMHSKIVQVKGALDSDVPSLKVDTTEDSALFQGTTKHTSFKHSTMGNAWLEAKAEGITIRGDSEMHISATKLHVKNNTVLLQASDPNKIEFHEDDSGTQMATVKAGDITLENKTKPGDTPYTGNTVVKAGTGNAVQLVAAHNGLTELKQGKISFPMNQHIHFYRTTPGASVRLNDELGKINKRISDMQRLMGGNTYALSLQESQRWLSTYSEEKQASLDLQRASTFKEGDARIALQLKELYRRIEYLEAHRSAMHVDSIGAVVDEFGYVMTATEGSTEVVQEAFNVGEALADIREIVRSLKVQKEKLVTEETQVLETIQLPLPEEEYLFYARLKEEVYEHPVVSSFDGTKQDIDGVEHAVSEASTFKLYKNDEQKVLPYSTHEDLPDVCSRQNAGAWVPVLYDATDGPVKGYLYWDSDAWDEVDTQKYFTIYSRPFRDPQYALYTEEVLRGMNDLNQARPFTVRYLRLAEGNTTATFTGEPCILKDSMDRLRFVFGTFQREDTENRMVINEIFVEPDEEFFDLSSTSYFTLGVSVEGDASSGSVTWRTVNIASDYWNLKDAPPASFSVTSFNLNSNGFVYSYNEVPVSLEHEVSAQNNESYKLLSGDTEKLALMVQNGASEKQGTVIRFPGARLPLEYGGSQKVFLDDVNGGTDAFLTVKRLDSGEYEIDKSDMGFGKVSEYMQSGTFFDGFAHIGKLYTLTLKMLNLEAYFTEYALSSTLFKPATIDSAAQDEVLLFYDLVDFKAAEDHDASNMELDAIAGDDGYSTDFTEWIFLGQDPVTIERSSDRYVQYFFNFMSNPTAGETVAGLQALTIKYLEDENLIRLNFNSQEEESMKFRGVYESLYSANASSLRISRLPILGLQDFNQYDTLQNRGLAGVLPSDPLSLTEDTYDVISANINTSSSTSVLEIKIDPNDKIFDNVGVSAMYIVGSNTLVPSGWTILRSASYQGCYVTGDTLYVQLNDVDTAGIIEKEVLAHVRLLSQIILQPFEVPSYFTPKLNNFPNIKYQRYYDTITEENIISDNAFEFPLTINDLLFDTEIRIISSGNEYTVPITFLNFIYASAGGSAKADNFTCENVTYVVKAVEGEDHKTYLRFAGEGVRLVDMLNIRSFYGTSINFTSGYSVLFNLTKVYKTSTYFTGGLHLILTQKNLELKTDDKELIIEFSAKNSPFTDVYLNVPTVYNSQISEWQFSGDDTYMVESFDVLLEYIN